MAFMNNTKRHSTTGFTLAELAIVIIIIGLLLVALLKGWAMIEQSRVKAVMAQVKYIDAASAGYFQKYNAMPGDHSDAMAKVTGCTAANSCVNGNGSGQIGVPVADFGQDNQAGNTALPQVETAMFWKHMVMGDFITDIDPTANPATPGWHATHPAAKGFGGYSVLFAVSGGAGQPQGHYVSLRPVVAGTALAGGSAIKGELAAQIDTAMDDGLATSGAVQSAPNGGLCADDAGNYVTNTFLENCIMIFKLHTM
jgi:type II secretory pathway pseudopilin PulG